MSSAPRVSVKLFGPEPEVGDGDFVSIFHQWIRDSRGDAVLLDVADYSHVPEGPGIMLVSHAVAFSLDRSEGRFGLRAQQRRPVAGGDAGASVAATIRAAVETADRLERESRLVGRVRFDRRSIRIEANDRLRIPNSNPGYASFSTIVRAACAAAFPNRPVELQRVERPPRERLAIDVTFADQ